MRPVAVYSALRLGLFLVALLVLRLLGVGGLLSLVIALVLSMMLSFVILRRQRDAVTLALMNRKGATTTPTTTSAPAAPRPRRRRFSERFADRLAADAAAEDAEAERLRGERPEAGSSGVRG
jgi:hypothetical protein